MIYDISPLINDQLAVFPGDAPFVLKRTIEKTYCQASQIQCTLHLGAHCDAACHTDPSSGRDITSIPLETFIGPCQVVRLDKPLPPITTPRILFITDSYPDPYQWRDDFAALNPELIGQLAEDGVILIGIDTPSIDPAHSQSLPAHHACRQHGITNLEGLLLTDVPEGEYQLIALPLNIADADASPVRAILQTL